MRNKNFAFLVALCAQDSFAAFAFRFHLLFHRVLNLTRRKNVFKLNAVDLDAPRVGRLVKDSSDFSIDCVTRGQRVVKLKLADDISERCCSKIFNRRNGILNAVSIKLRVGDLIENNGVNLHCNVVLCNNGLRLEVNNLLLERNNFCNAFKYRNFNMQSRLPGCTVRAEPFNDVRF